MSVDTRASRPGRPLGFDRDEALTRVMNLFWTTGYNGVTQQQMAAATGLSTSSLYNTFGTKIQIYREAMGLYLRRMQAVIEPLKNGARGSDDVLLTLERLADVLDSSQGKYGCMATTAMTSPVDPDVTKATDQYREQLRAGFAAAARRARALGESAPYPDTAANVMTAAILGTLTIARAAPNSPELATQLGALRAFAEQWRR